jgi:alpha-tubulin suppressor-like RCC1 family protein
MGLRSLSDNTMKCWGSNEAGQLGNGTTIDSSVPVLVKGVSTAIAVATGSRHTCALLSSGKIQCWGALTYQPDKKSSEDSTTAVMVPGISSATAIEAGWVHTCAAISHGTVKCWGGNSIGGMFSEDTRVVVSPPVEIEGLF